MGDGVAPETVRLACRRHLSRWNETHVYGWAFCSHSLCGRCDLRRRQRRKCLQCRAIAPNRHDLDSGEYLPTERERVATRIDHKARVSGEFAFWMEFYRLLYSRFA